MEIKAQTILKIIDDDDDDDDVKNVRMLQIVLSLHLDFIRSNEFSLLFVGQIVKSERVDFLERNFHFFLEYLLGERKNINCHTRVRGVNERRPVVLVTR